ncbi:MAG: S8/S53 family peptidase [Burkholderiales bacterium]|nr:S8/S53 family peptidase [Burkholderiales bacterium]
MLRVILGVAMASGLHTQALAETADPLYLVYMNPFVVQEYEQGAIDAGYVRPEIPVMIREEEKDNYLFRNLDQFKYSPGVERTKSEIARQFSLRHVKETASPMPAFYARLNESEVRELVKSDRVVSVDRMDTDGENFTFSSYYDYTSGGEVIPWGKQAVGANDIVLVNNNFYIVDAPYNSPALRNEINLSYTDTPTTALDGYHAAHILSIVAAKVNSFGIRGINTGQQIVHLETDLTDPSIINKIALIAAMSEWRGQFSTLNLSFNYDAPNQSSNPFNHEASLGRVIRRASGRLFVAQSAGNHSANACLKAFNYNGAPVQTNDGIMVVGGTDRFGDRYPQTWIPYPYGRWENRSNYGSCVDVWAPGNEMTTTMPDGTLISMTGTSFSAPIVAAIAGRYGNASTRPIERESYIRNGMAFTGKYDGAAGSNLPIYLAQYTPPSWHNIPRQLPVAAVYSNTNTTNLNKLVDQQFYDGIDWNAGGQWGSIVLDLGSVKNLKGVRVMIRSSAAGGLLAFTVHGGNSITMTGPGIAVTPSNVIATKNITDQYDLVPYYIPFDGNYRYVMIEANNTVSWLSYSEVEVYGH